MRFLRFYLVAIALTVSASCGKGDDGPKKVEPCGNGLIDLAETCDTAIESGEGACPTECPSTDPCNAEQLVGSIGACTAECVPIVRTCGDSDECCPIGCSSELDDDCGAASLCGNGTLDAGEDCDPAIVSGRNGACECPQTNAACMMTQLQGNPAQCSMQCVQVGVTTCDSGDGCCPANCEVQGDSDCQAVCGNGVTEGAELCDGNCPSNCDDGDDCTLDTLSGSSSNCDVSCEYDVQTSCIDSDGCCPNGCTPAQDSDCDAVCGNGIVEAGETCDGNCPTQCDDGVACTTDNLVGNAASCDVECSSIIIAVCTGGDGCCPNGCTSANDADCTAICGNGIVEGTESCDGNCPTACNDGDACTTNVLSGSPASCNVQCAFNPVTACVNNDGCCPTACNAAMDNDCSATCGNNVVEGVETCDGNCPTACDDSDACTLDVLSGSPASCTALCSYPDITACTNGDGCCPAGCAFANDDDCPCIPDTCASLGWGCGMVLDDGCGGGGEVCGTCTTDRTCVSNQCELNFGVGGACVTDGDCPGVAGTCITQLVSGWDGGYCTRGCSVDADCGAPNHCGADGFCWQNCTSDSDCRTGYLCFDDDGDSVGECAPAGTGTGVVGAPCSRFADCGGGSSGWCATPASQFNGGFCSRDCTIDADCPAGSHCFGGEACVPDCNATGDCRGAGYECYDGDNDAQLECYRFANGAQPVGNSCTGLWDCAGGQWGWCNRAADGWTGGYCTVFCGPGTSTCPNGSACYNDGQKQSCVDTCQNVNQCRAGYQCTDPGGLGANACYP